MKCSLVILFWLGFVNAVHAQVVRFDLFAAMDGSFRLEDGSFTNFWGYGLQGEQLSMPAPMLTVTTGDSVVVAMKNLGPEAHTIHLHGLDVDQVNDGVPATSFFVFANDSAEYRFTAVHPGTYLYHCHVTTTLHLTMGMYGMILVEHPGQVLYDGGPSYAHQLAFLASDLERRVNDAPLLSFPFHEIVPDNFMINGKSGPQIINDTTLHVNARVGEPVALRLGNMAYSRARFIMPAGANAKAYMSDGRPLPNAIAGDTLDLYPGERFSVIMDPMVSIDDFIEVQYFNMLSNDLQHTNWIPVHFSSTGQAHEMSWSIGPNPASGHVVINVQGASGEWIQWFAADGRLVRQDLVQPGANAIPLPYVAPGTYLLQDVRGGTQRLVVHRSL